MVSLFKHKSETYKALLDLKIIWSTAAMIAIIITMIEGGPNTGWLILLVFLIFNLVWVYYRVKIK